LCKEKISCYLIPNILVDRWNYQRLIFQNTATTNLNKTAQTKIK